MQPDLQAQRPQSLLCDCDHHPGIFSSESAKTSWTSQDVENRQCMSGEGSAGGIEVFGESERAVRSRSNADRQGWLMV